MYEDESGVDIENKPTTVEIEKAIAENQSNARSLKVLGYQLRHAAFRWMFVFGSAVVLLLGCAILTVHPLRGTDFLRQPTGQMFLVTIMTGLICATAWSFFRVLALQHLIFEARLLVSEIDTAVEQGWMAMARER